MADPQPLALPAHRQLSVVFPDQAPGRVSRLRESSPAGSCVQQSADQWFSASCPVPSLQQPPSSLLPDPPFRALQICWTHFPQTQRKARVPVMLGFRLFSAAMAPSSRSPWSTFRTILALNSGVYFPRDIVWAPFVSFGLSYHVHDSFGRGGLFLGDHYSAIDRTSFHCAILTFHQSAYLCM